MSLITNLWRAALAASVLSLAACGGSSNSAESPASIDSAVGAASIVKAASVVKEAAATAASPNGTNIPAAAQIIDSGGNVWTVVVGVIDENGAPASISSNVALLLYDNNNLYQQNSAGDWYSWNGSTWIPDSDPRLTPSLIGTTVPAATQITDSSGNVWAIAGGVAYENGALASYSSNVTLLLYDNDNLYQENADDVWYAWNGSTWIPGSDPRATPSPNGTAIPAVTQITDGSGNVWVVAGGLIYENGALAGYSVNVTELAYEGGVIYQENAAGIWWSWNGSYWAASNSPWTANLSWTAPTENTDGTPLTDLAGYTIFYGASPSALTQTIQVTDPSATSYVVSNLSSGTYYFTVAANASDGTQSAQSAAGSKAFP